MDHANDYTPPSDEEDAAASEAGEADLGPQGEALDEPRDTQRKHKAKKEKKKKAKKEKRAKKEKKKKRARPAGEADDASDSGESDPGAGDGPPAGAAAEPSGSAAAPQLSASTVVARPSLSPPRRRDEFGRDVPGDQPRRDHGASGRGERDDRERRGARDGGGRDEHDRRTSGALGFSCASCLPTHGIVAGPMSWPPWLPPGQRFHQAARAALQF